MSGGHFTRQYSLSEFISELENEIADKSLDYEKETIDALKMVLEQAIKTNDLIRATDYLFSFDIGEETFLKKFKEITKK